VAVSLIINLRVTGDWRTESILLRITYQYYANTIFLKIFETSGQLDSSAVG